ncbi:protease modulator HflC [Saccharophagus sp. K07]|uniref:protease modulator HflC n=1 Tax=Saccharophagus sp. K07 TaxID=2283636 RepID=UPI001652A62B|nr:protease modulator HflC [Saccharophagus sp. K07]MBC6905814.1 protease modulator HflC [Saccharophagus sp. K07]
MTPRAMFSLVALVVVILLGAQSVYIITEIERAVLLRLGKVVNPDVSTGLHWKIPFVDQVRRFDGRILTLEARAERFLTVEKKSTQVDSYAKWRIVDVTRYYTATSGDQERAERLLSQRINEGLRNEFATRSLQEVVSGERDQLMVDLRASLNRIMVESMGVEVVDVRVKKIDLPDEVSEQVYKRMSAEREREAKEHRAIGNEQAEIIRAEADRQRVVIEANAYSQAEKIRGEGDARAASIYAEAFGQSPEFYSFIRSLNAYKETFSGREDLILLDPKSDFFRYFNALNKK